MLEIILTSVVVLVNLVISAVSNDSTDSIYFHGQCVYNWPQIALQLMLATVHHGRTIYILGCNLLTKVGIGLEIFDY